MSESSSVRKEIAIVAGPREWGDTRESWLARVCKRVPTVSFVLSARSGTAKFALTITGQLATSDAPQNSLKPIVRRPPLRLATSKSSEATVRRTRIFIARKLIALSASLAGFALWIAPEIAGGGK